MRTVVTVKPETYTVRNWKNQVIVDLYEHLAQLQHQYGGMNGFYEGDRLREHAREVAAALEPLDSATLEKALRTVRRMQHVLTNKDFPTAEDREAGDTFTLGPPTK
jgi:hypothetical protein